MIRADRFAMSHHGFAVNLATYRSAGLTERTVNGEPRFAVHARIDAVWYRRKLGVTRACLGSISLWAHALKTHVDVTDPLAVLAAELDGRHGGQCDGRWDGERYWGAQEPETQALHLAVLRPMLDDCPSMPDGYDGWWRFTA